MASLVNSNGSAGTQEDAGPSAASSSSTTTAAAGAMRAAQQEEAQPHPPPGEVRTRTRVTSLRSAQVPRDLLPTSSADNGDGSTAGGLDVGSGGGGDGARSGSDGSGHGKRAGPTAIQILAARYSGPTHVSSTTSSSAAAAAVAAAAASSSAGGGLAASAAMGSAANGRRMSTPVLALVPPPPPQASSQSAAGGARGQATTTTSSASRPSFRSQTGTSIAQGSHPPSAAMRAMRKRREAGSLDLAAARATASSNLHPRAGSPLLPPPASPLLLNGLAGPSEEAIATAAAAGTSTPEADATVTPAFVEQELDSQEAVAATVPAASVLVAPEDDVPNAASPQPISSQSPHLAQTAQLSRATSPAPSVASSRSQNTTTTVTAAQGRQRRVSATTSAGTHGTPSFAQPTLASEKRRLANMTQLVNVLLARNVNGSSTSMNDPAHPSKANGPNASPAAAAAAAAAAAKQEAISSKVIESLTAELDAVRAQLESTTTALAQANKTCALLERDRDTLRDGVHRARTESDTMAAQLARNDRALADALERARRAEAESRERGRQGREWGARVRAVEDELGIERRERARAEAAYEAVAVEWKRMRESWRAEVEAVREEWREAKAREEREMEVLRARVAEVSLLGRAMAAGRSGEGEGEGDPSAPRDDADADGQAGQDKKDDALAPFRRVLAGLESERLKMESWAQSHIDVLVAQLEEEMARRAQVEAGLEEVRAELARILRLARAGVTEA